MVHIFSKTREFWDFVSIYVFFASNYLVFVALAFIGFLNYVTTFEPFLPHSTNNPFTKEDDIDFSTCLFGMWKLVLFLEKVFEKVFNFF
jgi:hypothetical protein